MRLSVIFISSLSALMIACTNSETAPGNDKLDHQVLLLQDFDVITMRTGLPEILIDTSILIEDGKIISVGPSESIKAPKSSKVIEGKGRTILPGLTDMHVHVWDEAELAAYLAYGITSVRNTSGMPFHLKFQELIEEGSLLGPRLFTTGPILNSPGPNAQVNHQIVQTDDEARRAVAHQYKQGYRRLKVYSNLNRDAYEAILDEADKLGMSIMGHTPEGRRDEGIPFEIPFNISFNEVLDDGFVTIEHMESIVWHGLNDNFDIDKARALAKKIAKSGVVVSPTLIAHRNLVEVSASEGAFLKRPDVEMLNPFITETEQESYQFWSSQPANARKVQDEFYFQITKIFHDEGVTLVAGTDAGIFTNIPGRSLISELGFYVDAGLSPYEALMTATKNPARVLGLEQEAGEISEGFRADLLVLDDNPITNIDALNSISGVIVNGRWFDKAGIKSLRDQARATSYERTEQRVLSGLEVQGSEF